MRPFAIDRRRRAGAARWALGALLCCALSGCADRDGAAAAQRAAVDIVRIQRAATSYYRDNGAWPASMRALRRTGYLKAKPDAAPWGAPYRLRLGQRGLSVLVAVREDAQFETLRRYFGNSLREDQQVAVPLARPARWPRRGADDAAPARGDDAGVRSNAQRLMGR